MSLEKALAKEGLQLEGDSLSKEHRNVKTFKRLIAAIRACEAQVQDDLQRAQVKLTDALEENARLRERLFELENIVRHQKVREVLEEIGTVSTAERTRLLEVVA